MSFMSKSKKICRIGFSLSLLITLFISNSLFSAAPDPGAVLVTVGKEKITYSDIEKAWMKNMNRNNKELWELHPDSAKSFLELYVNYRLKVNDAIDRGFDKDSSVIADIENNRRILAESYYFDKELVDPNVEKILKKRESEMKIAVILLAFDNSKPIPDTVEAFKKATEAMNRIKKGEDFGKIAKDLSDDKETAKRDGVVPGWITAGRVQRPIEDAIYGIDKIGGITPELVRAKFGYFIIKLLDRKKTEFVRGKHILISGGKKNEKIDARAKADSILKLLKNGADFAELAEANSDDPGSAMRGGDIGAWYSRSFGLQGTGRSLMPEFEEGLYSLKDGEISGLVKTDYGYHIIMRDSTKKYDPKQESSEAKKLYKKLYFENDKKELKIKLKKDCGFKYVENVYNAFFGFLDTTKTTLDSAWDAKLPETIMDKPLFRFLDKEYSVAEFVDMLENKIELRGTSTNRKGIDRAVDKIIEPIMMQEATKNLEKDYPDFAALMREFRDGILLFKVEAIEVWDNLKFDSTLAKEYYEQRKEDYQTSPAYDLAEIFVMKDSLARDIYEKAKSGEDFSALAETHTQRGGYREKKGERGVLSIEKSDLAKAAFENKAKAGDIIAPIKNGRGYSVIKVNKFLDSRQKTFEEAIPDFAPDFQDMMQKRLTQKWLKKVKEKHAVEINRDNFKKIFKN